MADQWDKTKPVGTDLISTIDDSVIENNAALDRLLFDFRHNCMVTTDTSAQFTVLSGEIAIPNSGGSIVRWRRNTSSTTVTWSDLDTGGSPGEAGSTQYYVYAVADADATTFTVSISASASAPDGKTFYRLIGYFFNNSALDIIDLGNVKGGDVHNILEVESAGTDVQTTSTSYVDVTNMTAQFYTSGRPILVAFTAVIDHQATDDAFTQFTVDVDGTDYGDFGSGSGESTDNNAIAFSFRKFITGLASGIHTVKIQWRTSSGTADIDATQSTDIDYSMVIEEV